MTNRFYLISNHDGGNLVALVEAPSQRSALFAYAERFHKAKAANARDVAVAFQLKVLIISASDADALPVEENVQA